MIPLTLQHVVMITILLDGRGGEGESCSLPG